MALKNLTNNGVSVGVAVVVDALKNNSQYSKLITNEFNSISPENALKWEFLSTEKGVYNFDDVDYLVRFAQKNKMVIHGHVLTWNKQLPKWLMGGSFSSKELKGLLVTHITTLVTRYRNKINRWDVVNEAINYNRIDKTNFWYKKLGMDYLDLSFHTAHEANPEAILLYNEWGAEDMGIKANTQFKLLKELVSRKCPVGGVGLQMHLVLDYCPPPTDILENIKRLKGLGLKVYITEMDIRLRFNKGNLKELLEKQARKYNEIISSAIREIDGITFWGLDDQHSWVPYSFEGEGTALLFDKKLNPKPAYFSVAEALDKNWLYSRRVQ